MLNNRNGRLAAAPPRNPYALPPPARVPARSAVPNAPGGTPGATAVKADADDRQGGAAPIPSKAAATASPPPVAAWRETGRAERGDALWITWMAPLGDREDVLYRSLVVADGALEVSVELEPRPGGGAVRAVHRGRCGLPPSDEAGSMEGRAALLLAAADKAVARALGAARKVDEERAPARADGRRWAPEPRP